MTFYKRERPPLDLAQTKRKIMDLLARRDHSIKELTKKLKERTNEDILTKALAWAKEQNWLPSEEKLTELTIKSLRGRKKGAQAINAKLKELGLKTVKLDDEQELDTALKSLNVKFKSDFLSGIDYNELKKNRAKVMRFLAGKGFSMTTIQKAIKTYFQTTQSDDEDNTYE